MRKRLLVLICAACSLGFGVLQAQGYQALHGSAFTGSTAVFNNPASSVNSAYKWDLTLFSVQAKISTNSLFLQTQNGSTGLTLKDDFNSKFIHANADLSLFNFLYKPDNEKAFNFGIRARTYTHVKSMPFQYADDVSNIHTFLIANQNTPYVQAFATNAGWLEADLNYSQVLNESSNSRLTGGVTLQVMKGMSGAFIKLNKVSYLTAKNATDTSFTFTGGGVSLGYTAGFDAESFGEFNKSTLSALGLSMGIEYMTYASDINSDAGNNNLNYDWKIGVSLMDLGANKFKPSSNSTEFYNPKSSIPDSDIDTKLGNTTSLQDFKDSLNTVFGNSATITDNFSISNPARLIVNIDKNLGNHFYVNGELSMNFYSTSSATKLHTRELNLLTITPKWETIAWGVYLPVQYNTQGQLWIGMAIKAGPLVLGFHNLGLLQKDTLINGGGYLLFSMHPFSRKSVMNKLGCPQ